MHFIIGTREARSHSYIVVVAFVIHGWGRLLTRLKQPPLEKIAPLPPTSLNSESHPTEIMLAYSLDVSI
jgi:hypothetical protein